MANYDLTYEGSEVQKILDTGDELQTAGYIFLGMATPSTVPGTPTERVAYIGGPGTYNNFGSSFTVGAGCICVFKYTGSAWSNQVINTGLDSAVNTLQSAITAINNNIGNGYVYAGVATPSTSPVTGKVFYLAVQAGTYTNFGSLAVTEGINILKYNGSAWSVDQAIAIDAEPTQGSDHLVKSGGVLNSIIQNGPAFDLSAYNAQGGVLATYADLSAALTALNALPAAYKKGGMSFKFVRTYDNKYVQYRLTTKTFSTTVSDWEEIDSGVKATASSAESDLDIADENGNVLVRFANGHVKVKYFDSADNNESISAILRNVGINDIPLFDEEEDYEIDDIVRYNKLIYKFTSAHEAGEWDSSEVEETNIIAELDVEHPINVETDFSEADLDISDEQGNVLARFANGHIEVKNFDSAVDAAPPLGTDIYYNNEVVPVINANSAFTYKQHKVIGTFEFDFKWVGGCLASNGRIYGISNGNRQILEINPNTDAFCLFGQTSAGSFKWSGCGIWKNGLIYGYPRSANSVLVVNPISQGVKEVALGTNYGQDHHYGGCIVGDYMYLAPRTADHILKINLRTWKLTELGKNILTTTTRYSCCIYHPNGYIYFIPESNAKVLKLNPVDDSIVEIGNTLTSCNVYGASVAPYNKCIYGFTAYKNDGGILKIDVENNDAVSFIQVGTVGTGYYSTELGLNGKLYSGVGNGTDVWELDPTDDSVLLVDTISDTDGGNYNEAKCAGGILSENGSIYLIPAKGRHIYKLEFNGEVVRTMPRKVLSSNYFSNY